MKTLIQAACLMTALGSGVSSSAADLYVGLTGGEATLRGERDPEYGREPDRHKKAAKLFGGWAVSPNFSVEGGYVNFSRLGEPSFGNATVKAQGGYADLIGRYPATPELSLHARAGVFYGAMAIEFGRNLSVTDEGVRAKAGLGFTYAVTRSVGLQADWERYRFDVFGLGRDVDLLSAGVRFGF